MRDLHSLVPNGIGGGCSKQRGEAIQKTVFDTNAQFCVEIGVFRGSSLMYFVEALEETGGKIVGIDPYTLKSVNEIPNKKMHDLIYNVLFKEQQALDNVYEELVVFLDEQDLSDTVSLVREKSEDYQTNLDNESIDVLHIDGNHDYEYVSKDILLYLPLVKKGGYIIMDDIKWKGVRSAIDKFMTAKLISDHGSFAVFRK